ncbi:MAG TPA: hypothetical protein VI894_02545 [Candidatus Nanoarchaeia archaeon]|nr:hypothetical protein [Candidatus Nanoarchaeia archaeon]
MANVTFWIIVMLIQLLNVLLFGYLMLYFLNLWKKSEGESKVIMWVMVTMTSVILIVTVFSYIDNAVNPLKGDMFLQDFYPEINTIITLFGALIVAFSSLTIIWALRKVGK